MNLPLWQRLSCRENGITNVIATMWGDDGAECSIFEALLSLQLYGEYNYADEVTEEGLSQMFEICTGYTSEEFGIFNIEISVMVSSSKGLVDISYS